MSKKTDKEKAAQIMRNGFTLPAEIEEFFNAAKARAVKSVIKARMEVIERIADFRKNMDALWDAAPESEKVEVYLKWNGERITRRLMKHTWAGRKETAIYRKMPYRGYNNADAVRKTEEDCDAKRVQFIIRTNAITGDTITGAALHLDFKSGDVNGTITGERGTASVKTIGAGGYNIQCYHFRCLVRELKKGGAK